MTITETTVEALAFRLGEEEYGVDILKVQEIREHAAVIRLAMPILLDIERLMSSDELGLIEGLAA